MLLNELQAQQQRSELQAKKQAEQLTTQAKTLEALQLRIAELERSMQGRASEQ